MKSLLTIIGAIECMFKGHVPVSKKRKEDILYAIQMYGYDVWGHSAFSNMDRMDELRAEYMSCTRCNKQIINVKWH